MHALRILQALLLPIGLVGLAVAAPSAHGASIGLVDQVDPAGLFRARLPLKAADTYGWENFAEAEQEMRSRLNDMYRVASWFSPPAFQEDPLSEVLSAYLARVREAVVTAAASWRREAQNSSRDAIPDDDAGGMASHYSSLAYDLPKYFVLFSRADANYWSQSAACPLVAKNITAVARSFHFASVYLDKLIPGQEIPAIGADIDEFFGGLPNFTCTSETVFEPALGGLRLSEAGPLWSRKTEPTIKVWIG